ncbi:MAG: ATP-NAD kinase family protein [Candidatus Binatia bacterium]
MMMPQNDDVMVRVGIIANPASGKDIRRLVAHGTVFDNVQKVDIVRRVLLGLNAMGVREVLFMPEPYGIVERAYKRVCRQLQLGVRLLEMEIECTQEDSTRAASLLSMLGCRCIITLGGDGTNRAVAKGSGQVPLLPVSTGTNNVFPFMVEGTTAGLAAGVVARVGGGEEGWVRQAKRLNVLWNGQVVDLALIDVAVSCDTFAGSRALWEASRIRQVVATRGEPHYIGLSSICGAIHPIGAFEGLGINLLLGEGGRRILAPIAPGMIQEVRVRSEALIQVGDRVAIAHQPAMISLDGEREIYTGEGEGWEIELSAQGPRVVQVEEALRWAAQNRFFQSV